MTVTDGWDRSARQLGLLRIVLFGSWLVLLSMTRLDLLAGMPRDALRPTGLALFLPLDLLLEQSLILVGIQVATMGACAAAMAGLRPWRLIGGSAALLVLVTDGLMKAIGWYDNHAQFALVVGAVVLAASPASDGLSLGRRQAPVDADHTPVYGAPMFAIGLLMTTAYALVAARRVADGGFEVFLDHSMRDWSIARSLEDHHYPWDFGLVLLEHSWILPVVAVGFVLTTLFELASPLALAHRRFRFAWLAVLVPFHVGTLVLMGIFFWENLLLLLVLFTTWPHRIVAEFTNLRGPWRGSPRPRHQATTTGP